MHPLELADRLIDTALLVIDAAQHVCAVLIAGCRSRRVMKVLID